MSGPENRSVSFFGLFRHGQHYAKTWPLDKRLAPVFIENRIIRATRYAIRIMPPVAIFTLCWQIALGGQLGPAVEQLQFAQKETDGNFYELSAVDARLRELRKLREEDDKMRRNGG